MRNLNIEMTLRFSMPDDTPDSEIEEVLETYENSLDDLEEGIKIMLNVDEAIVTGVYVE